MIVVGITGGIASGKTTVVNFLRKKRIAIHDSDLIVKKTYLNPSSRFINYLKKIGLKNSLKGKKINKKIIQEEIFTYSKKRKLLETYLHKKVRIARNKFLKTHQKRKTKIVFLDIPLLFENKLDKICDYTILLYAPIKLRKKRAMKRKGMKKIILEKIMKSQLSDRIKKRKATFIIDTTNTKTKTFQKILFKIGSTKQQWEKSY